MKVSNKKLLIADNDEIVRKVLATRLTILGYRVFLASNGKGALNVFNTELLDLVIIDIMLPKLDGYEVCRKIRENSQVPIIILTGLGGISDRVFGLELGADDYIVKPFSPKELEARIKSVLRRTTPKLENIKEQNQSPISFGDLIIDLHKRSVFKNNAKVQLTGIEFNILELLITNAGKKLSRNMILDNVWGYTPERYVDTRVVDVHVSRLRSKLERNGSKPEYILTVRSVGYMFQYYY